jgi:hypothetical protein
MTYLTRVMHLDELLEKYMEVGTCQTTGRGRDIRNMITGAD